MPALKKTNESLVLANILKKIAPRIGARVFLEPEWNVAGQITFKNGKRSYFRYNTLDLNPMGASEIARDKDYANFFMQSMGYPIVPGSKSFYSPEWARAIGAPQRSSAAAYQHALALGFPVFVKPNSGSQGTDVTLAHNKRELLRALRAIFRRDRVALVQQPVHGKDYRLVVLDNQIISAYERSPLCVLGDGKSTIDMLLTKKQLEFTRANRDTRIRNDDRRIITKLKRQSLTLQSIPAAGHNLQLLDNANLSTGGDSQEVTDRVHPDFKKFAIDLTCDMGLRLCGVDLMIAGDIAQAPGTYWVLEINSAPGLDHYAKSGKKQERVVEDLYLTVLRHLEFG